MADPISGTIAAVAAVVTSVTSAVVAAGPLAVAAFNAVNIAAVVGVGLAVASPLLQPKVGSSGPTMDFKSDTTAPIRGVMGRMAIGGNRIFKRTWGRTNVYLTSVALLSLGPCQAVEQFKANDQFVSFGQSQGGASGKYAGHMWMTYRYGLPGTSALTPPQGVFIENPKLTAWTSQHRADGHVTAMWTLAQAEDVQKRDLYTQGEPDALWIGRWMKVWDPRQDSTYPGGSGSQRRDQWNTWGYTDNPYLHAIAWIRGHAKLNADGSVDRTKRIAGVGAPERAIDIANYVEGANIADANGWKIAGEWSTSDDKWQVLAAMLQAGGGVPLNRGAQISCMVNTPRASIYTYTRNDLVGGATVKALKARRDRKNTVVPRYRSEAHGWEIVPAGAVTSSVYRAEDRGEPRTIEIEYSYVTSAKQAGELGAYDVANMREGLETSLPSKPHLLGLRAGDAFTTDLPELGLVAQKFIVQRRAFDPQTGVVTLDVLSETDAKHAWALGQTANPPPTPSLVGVDPDYVAPPELPEWTVVTRPPAGDGSQQPGFEIIGGSPAADASSVVMEHGQSPTGPWKQFYDGALKTTGRVPIDGLQPGETYYVAVRYRRDSSGALSDRAIYGPYTAPSLTAGDTAAVAGYPASDLLKDVQSVETLAGRTRDAVADLEQVYGDTASAAQSAADAAASQAGAIQAKADAVVARGEARTAAGDALAKAQAAAGSSAAADAAKTASETARDAAIQKALDAAGAAETAGAAKTAAETASAGAAAEALKAAQKAGEASGSAQAAAGSAGTASSKATEAGTAAAAALASSVTATTAKDAAVGAAIATMPDVIAADLLTAQTTGAPATRPNLPAAQVVNGAYTPPVGTNGVALFKSVVPWKQGEIYEVTIEVDGIAGSTPPQLSPYLKKLKADYSTVTVGSVESYSFADAPVGQTTRRAIRFGLGVLPAAPAGGVALNVSHVADVAFVRFGALVNYGSAADRQSRLKLLTIRNVTAQVAADTSAKAAATSASKAGAHEDAAGQSATAANTAKTQAETARGQAQGFRNEAADSATTATGAAATATQQAGLSAGARDQAQGHAAAASGSASTASSKADAAGQSATAAEASRVAAEAAREGAEGSAAASAESASSAAADKTAAGSSASAAQTARTGAETARGQAQTYASNASDSADDAAGSASTATQQAGQATTARNAAEGSADAAAGSASTASSKADASGQSASAAEASRVAAKSSQDAAKGSADAASTSASTAATKATEAGTSASAANTAKTAAETARSQAQTFRDEASDSADDANGAAATATQQAGLATTARNDAAGSASAALTSRNQASGFATAAETAAAASASSSVSASTAKDAAVAAAVAGFPDVIAADLLAQTQAGAPNSRPRVPAAQVVNGVYTPPVGADGTAFFGQYIPWEVGKVYEVVAEVEGISAASGVPHAIIYGNLNDAAYARLVDRWAGGWVPTPVGQTTRLAYRIGLDVLPPTKAGFVSANWTGATGAAWVNLGPLFNRPGGGGTSQAGAQSRLTKLTIRDVTAVVAADTSAKAAATSASNAAASATLAGEKATAAQASATAADTSRAQAQTAASQASQSETNAAGSAASASTAAQNAATSRDQASGFATAASGSASTASTKAGEAGTSAAAALASQVSASTAKDAAVAAAIATMPDVIAADLLTTSPVGAPASVPSLPAAEVSNGAYTPPVGSTRVVAFKAVVPWKQGEIYDVTVEVEGLAGSAAPTMSPYVRKLKADFSGVTVDPVEHYSFANAPVGQVTRRVVRFGMGLLPAAPVGGVAINVTETGGTAFVRFGALVNYGSAADRQSRLKLLTVRNVTAQVAADTSAKAAATSASNASASETAAGQKATAAEGSASTAATRAGEAQTYRNQAATSESNAAGSASSAAASAGTAATARDQAIGARDGAQAAAATAVSQASDASASAALAQVSANLAASAGDQTGAVQNNRFLLWPDGQVRPTYWDDWSNANSSPTVERRNDGQGAGGVNNRRTMRHTYAAGQGQLGVSILQKGFREGVYLLEADVSIPFGGSAGTGFVGAGVLVEWFSDQGQGLGPAQQISFRHDKDINGVVNGVGAGDGRVYRFSKRIVAPVGTSQARIYAMTRFGGFDLTGHPDETKVLDWYRIDLVSASEADREFPAVSAQLSITAAVAADASARLASARFEVIAAAGNDPAQLLIRADTSGSLARMVASSIGFANVVGGQVIEAMKLIGGEVFFMRPIYIDVLSRRLLVGPGNGWVLWFGPNTLNASQATRTNGKFALGDDGEVYYGSAVLGGGSANGVKQFASGVGGSVTQSQPFAGVTAGSLVEVFGSLDGGALDQPNAAEVGTIIVREHTATADRELFRQPIAIESGGLGAPGPGGSTVYPVTGGGSFNGRAFGQYSGSVSYSVTFQREGGASYVQGAVINAGVTVTPSA